MFTVNRLKALATATAVATGTVLAIAVPASPAAATWNDGICTSQEICLWQNANRGGGKIDYFQFDTDFSNNKFIGTSTSVNDRVSSADSYEPYCYFHLFRDASYFNSVLTLDPFEYVADLSKIPGANDSASSTYDWC
jgi:hypothetical protein